VIRPLRPDRRPAQVDQPDRGNAPVALRTSSPERPRSSRHRGGGHLEIAHTDRCIAVGLIAWQPPPAAAQSSEISTEYLLTLFAPFPIDGSTAVVNVRAGGWVRGPHVNGRIIAPGGDWLRIMPSGARRLDVRLLIETNDGALVASACTAPAEGSGETAAFSAAEVRAFYGRYETAPVGCRANGRGASDPRRTRDGATSTTAQQMKNAYSDLARVLEHYGCTFDDVIVENVCTTEMAKFLEVSSYPRSIYTKQFPTGSWLEVKGLALPGLTIEIELEARSSR
jgi:2-iminobutanoate/2-iminopropanoate deaminase